MNIDSLIIKLNSAKDPDTIYDILLITKDYNGLKNDIMWFFSECSKNKIIDSKGLDLLRQLNQSNFNRLSVYQEELNRKAQNTIEEEEANEFLLWKNHYYVHSIHQILNHNNVSNLTLQIIKLSEPRCYPYIVEHKNHKYDVNDYVDAQFILINEKNHSGN